MSAKTVAEATHAILEKIRTSTKGMDRIHLIYTLDAVAEHVAMMLRELSRQSIAERSSGCAADDSGEGG